jgi:hypothetical protein
MSLQKRSVLLAQETDGYATLTDAQQTDAQTDASGSEDDGSATARAAAIEAAAWKRRKLQDDRMTREEGAVGDTRPRKGRPRKDEPRERVDKASEQGKRPNLWAFFRTMKQIEVKGTMHARRIPRKELLDEYKALSGPQQYYWTHMYELWRLYERQQVALWPLLKSKEDGRWRKRKLKLQFYYLSLAEQKKLVDDWIVERTARERDRRAQELEESLARKTLAKIKADMLAVVSNIDYVLREGRRPHKWQGAFEGI